MENYHMDELREKAEEYIISKPGYFPSIKEVKDPTQLLHELQVYQVELEMQNKELMDSRESLERSKTEYTHLFEHAPIGYFILNRFGIITKVNIAGCNIMGSQRNKVINNRFLSYVHPDNTKNFYDFLIKVLKSDEKESCEIQLMTNNKEVYVQIESVRVYDHETDAPVLLTTLMDITERYNASKALLKAHILLEQKVKQKTDSLEKANLELQIEIEDRKKAEKALKEQHELLSGIIEGTTDAIYVKDLQGKYLLINSAGCKMINKPAEEMLNKDDHNIFPQEEAVGLLKLNKKIIKTGKTYVLEHVLNFNGRSRKLLSTMGPYLDSDGEIKGVIGISHDVTEYNVAKNERMRFLQMLENSHNEFYLINADTLRFEYVNAQTCKKLGYPLEEIRNRPLFEIAPSLNEEEYIDMILPLIAGKKNKLTYFAEHRKSDGFKYPVEVNLQLLNEDKKFYILAVAEDVTNRKDAESALEAYAEECKLNQLLVEASSDELIELNQKLRQSEQELIELNANKDKFLYLMAHDLKSPFNSLIGSAQFLESYFEKLEQGEVRKFIKNINILAHNFKEILEDLLSLSSLHHGTMPFNPIEVDLDQYINNNIGLLEYNAEEKNINLIKGDVSNVVIKADKIMINSILQNLISNAIKFTHPGGTVAIASEDLGSEVLIKISDTGIGMCQSTIDKIFRIQAHHSTKGTANETGTGLGLILIKEFVEKHNGKIWAESEKGVGSTFFLTLPKNLN